MEIKTIALIGQPNAGKSTLFNVLSDIKTSTSNFAGTTVAIKESLINVNFETYKLIDLPGLYSLNANDLAEEVTVKYLLNEKVDLILNVVDSTLLARSLELTVELMELGLPIVISLNMQDEAQRYGVKIDRDFLQKKLNIPVISTTGLFGKGVKDLIETCDKVLLRGGQKAEKLNYTHHIENSINEIEHIIDAGNITSPINKRFYAIKLIENPVIVPKQIVKDTSEIVSKVTSETLKQHNTDGFELIAYERHHLAMKITHEVSEITQKKSQPFAEKLDAALLHPVWGYFFMLLFFVFYFVTIFKVGTFISGLLDPPLQSFQSVYAPIKLTSEFLWFTVDGLYQGFVGAVGIVLPYFLPLLFLTAFFEDTGYMSRIAFLLDSLFHKIGLHGKSVAPFIMGFGCTVPAIYATRIIENNRDRLITGILINFIPCSARLAVVFALSAAFTGPFWTMLIFFYVVFIISVNGKILSIFLSKPTGLILEIPNLRLPVLSSTIRKTYIKVREFLKVALPYLVAGSIVLGWLYYFGITTYINDIFSPLITYILGLPKELGSTLIFGFLRKELIIVMASQAMGVQNISQIGLTSIQAIVFTVFVILYVPCISTFAVFWKEFGRKTVILTAVFCIVLATISGYLFKLLGSII